MVQSRPSEIGHSRHPSIGDRASNSPTNGGFVAVNRYSSQSDRSHHNGSGHDHPRSNGPTTNGSTQLQGVSAATRAELLSKFHTTSDRSNSVPDGDPSHRVNSISRPSAALSKTNSRAYADSMEYAGVLLNTASPVPIPNTPSSLLPYVKPSPADRFDDSGPYKADMMARMEQLNRGDRVQPPCDRCRRLHMDCRKNLTACMGCTKKHAKCSWKDVEEQELKDHPFVLRVRTAEEIATAEAGSEGEGSRSGGSRSGGESVRRERRREMTEVRDEELLGEDLGEEDVEMKERPMVTHSPNMNNSTNVSAAGLSPSRADNSSRAAHQIEDSSRISNTMSMSNITNSSTARSRPESPQDTARSPYQAPQAQTQSYPADEINETTETNGHVQTEYERDIYSQLNEATRASSDQERAAANRVPREEAVRVYTAGSEPHEPPIRSPNPPAQHDTPQGSQEDPSREEQHQQQQPETHHTPPHKAPCPPHREHIHTPKPPQMPSPPLSGAPSQSTPRPNTPVLDQSLATAQPMQI